MNKQQFFQYLDNPQALNNESLPHLTALVADYPYFQLGRMLLVKNLSLTGHIRYNFELKVAAAHIPDRRQLYFLIHNNNEIAPLKPTNEVDVNETNAVLVDEVVELPAVEAVEENQFVVVESPVEPDIVVPIAQEVVENDVVAAEVALDNYFDVSDVIDISDGMMVDFSKPAIGMPEPETELLPTADLLDYELTESPAYQLDEDGVEPFNPHQVQPFSAWLKALRHNNIATVESNPEKPVISKQMQMIESFLQKGRDRIVPQNTEVAAPVEDISTPSLQESEALMTETLANIHIKQKQYHKAITIFEKLSLKYPEKSIYFATRILETERLITNP